MNERKCPLQLDHLVHLSTVRILEQVGIIRKYRFETLYAFFAFVHFQQGDRAKEVDLRASLLIPRDQTLGFYQELFSILESALFLALLCFFEEGGSSFQRLIEVGHVESLCHLD